MDQLVAARGRGHYAAGWAAKPVMTVRRRKMKRGKKEEDDLNVLQKVILVQGGLVGWLEGHLTLCLSAKGSSL